MTPAEKVQRNRGRIALNTAFWGTLLFSANLIERKDIPTAATDGKNIFYNPDFIGKLSNHQTAYVLIHEAAHIMLGHSWRLGGRDRKRANIAMDHVVNTMVMDGVPGTLTLEKPCAVHEDRALVKTGGGTWEGVYDLLNKGQKCSGPPDSFDQVLPGASGEEARTQAVVAKAVAAGKVPRGLEKIIDEILHPKVPWQKELRDFTSEYAGARTERSWRRPNRRGLDVTLPVRSPDLSMGNLAIGIDCSGSIFGFPEALAAFQAEISAIVSAVRPPSTTIINFDVDVKDSVSYGPDDDVKLKPVGGGGTSFADLMDFCAKVEPEPAALIVFTDMCCWNFGQAPSCPVLWCRYGAFQHDSIPFGREIIIP